ncbi:MAG TPA: hypothetical protein VM681_08000 [Candidatus Thermoplasmatota archaeon]|nr:hypothetical protein [Candidatus Thermoplasmatota archaeon]
MKAAIPLLVGFLLAGCVSPQAPEEVAPSSQPPVEESPEVFAPGWPSLADARIRPGIQIGTSSNPLSAVRPISQCTANFLFRSLDNRSLYLGTAAHCVDDLAVGDSYPLLRGAASATVAYVSFHTMKEIGETDRVARDDNDFALLRIDDEHRLLAHPAMLHYGGPVALADSSSVGNGERVRFYGNSDLRQDADPLSPHSGCVVNSNPWAIEFASPYPGIFGDSGSGALAADGAALGVVITLRVGSGGTSNALMRLDAALGYAREHAGVEVELVTWESLSELALPEWPC